MNDKLSELIKQYHELFPQSQKGIQQCADEIESLISFVGNQKFNHLAEIGSDEGGSIWLYANLFAAENAVITIVDQEIKPVLSAVVQTIKSRLPVRVVLIYGLSKDVYLDDVDFLHIDGDHSYEATHRDYVRNYAHVLPGGLILLHDTNLWEGPIKVKEELQGNITNFVGNRLIGKGEGLEPTETSTGITVVKKRIL